MSVKQHPSVDSMVSTTSPASASETECGSVRSEGSAQVQLEVEKAMVRLSDGIQDFNCSGLEKIKTLQQAARNHGSVDLMKRGGSFAAVKRMPTRWITASHEEFTQHHPKSSERPWFDMGVVAYLRTAGFPYVAELFGVWQDGSHTYVGMSLASEGDLFGWCDHIPDDFGAPREAALRPVARQLCSAVGWLHDLGIAHRDLSLENVLVHREGEGGELRIWVIDFGMGTLSRMCEKEICGKQSYSAPEMYHSEPYDAFLSDAFAVGVVLFGLAAQDYPWQSTKPKACQLFEYVRSNGFRAFLDKRKMRRGGRARLSDVFTPDLVALLAGLLAFEPEDRITLAEQCWRVDSSGRQRPNVWDMDWLNDWS